VLFRSLQKYLPADLETAYSVLDELATIYTGPCIYCLPDFVEVFGQDPENWHLSIAALGRYTQYASSELAIRPFIIQQPELVMAQMYAWSQHQSEHLRRLASEGCRPQLPWGPALEIFKLDPTPILPILEQLKTDPSPTVRRSVANNLNDISKTHPELVISLAKQWYGHHNDTDALLKHACRTLLKRGNREVLALFGLDDSSSVDVSGFAIGDTTVAIGSDLNFSFSIIAQQPTKVRLEYGIDFCKANGKTSRKIFQISEVSLAANSPRDYNKKHSFADLSTRKHYPGTHSIVLIVNGLEQQKLDFQVSSPVNSLTMM
jgi:3-methyladenine DNA glycosylase AlkC